MQFVEDGEERVVVGSLDLNQCLWLPDELTGKRPGVRLLLPFSMLLQNTDGQNIFFDSCDWFFEANRRGLKPPTGLLLT